MELYRQRVSTINQLADSILYCFEDFGEYDEKAAKKALRPVALEPLQCLQKEFSQLNEWKSPAIHQIYASLGSNPVPHYKTVTCWITAWLLLFRPNVTTSDLD